MKTQIEIVKRELAIWGVNEESYQLKDWGAGIGIEITGQSIKGEVIVNIVPSIGRHIVTINRGWTLDSIGANNVELVAAAAFVALLKQ